MVTKKIMLAVAAIAMTTALVFGTSSFDKKPLQGKSDATVNHKKHNETISEGKVFFAPTYFHFTGSPGQENDVTKWEQISEEDYDITYGDCANNNDGCRLKTDSTQMLSGSLRPKQVDVVSSGGHTNPITSLSSGVTEVGNENP